MIDIHIYIRCFKISRLGWCLNYFEPLGLTLSVTFSLCLSYYAFHFALYNFKFENIYFFYSLTIWLLLSCNLCYAHGLCVLFSVNDQCALAYNLRTSVFYRFAWMHKQNFNRGALIFDGKNQRLLIVYVYICSSLLSRFAMCLFLLVNEGFQN